LSTFGFQPAIVPSSVTRRVIYDVT